MRFKKSLPLFLAALLVMALAVGCAPAEQASETPAATEEMGHDDSMGMPDSAMADTTAGMGGMSHEGEGEGSSDH